MLSCKKYFLLSSALLLLLTIAACDDSSNDSSSNDSNYYTYYVDNDGDGYGDTNSSMESSSSHIPAGYVTNGSDCNDGNSSINPGAYDIVGDGIDQDCSGADIPDTTPPPVPRDMGAYLSYNGDRSHEVYLSWNAAGPCSEGSSGYYYYIDCFVGFKVYRDNIEIATVGIYSQHSGAGTYNYHDINLSAATIYCYTVTTYDAAGNESGQSDRACITTDP